MTTFLKVLKALAITFLALLLCEAVQHYLSVHYGLLRVDVRRAVLPICLAFFLYTLGLFYVPRRWGGVATLAGLYPIDL
jgi:hypothetical protein